MRESQWKAVEKWWRGSAVWLKGGKILTRGYYYYWVQPERAGRLGIAARGSVTECALAGNGIYSVCPRLRGKVDYHSTFRILKSEM